MILKITNQSCSACGSVEDLHAITYPYEEGSISGRLLVYCRPCRTDRAGMLNVSIPLVLMTESDLLDLYRTGQTESDPEVAVELITGVRDLRLIQKIQSILDAK